MSVPITAVGDFPLPDLVATNVSVSSPLKVGSSFSVSLTAANQGTASAPPFYVALVLSTDTTLSGEDVYFGGCFYPSGLTASTSGPCGFTDTYGTIAAAGTYHVLAVADSDILVPEHDETNNVTLMPGTVEVQ